MATAYQVGVHLAMTSNHTQVIQTLARDLLGINTTVGQLQNMFGRLGLAIAGAFAITGGMKFLGVMKDLVKHGSEFEHQLVLLRAAGGTNAEVMEAQTRAFQVSQAVQTTTIAENVKHLRELRYAFGDWEKATKTLETVSKVQAVLGSLAPNLKDQVWPLVKALESKGELKDEATFNQYIEKMMQAAVASGGRITPEAFYGTFKYGRTAMLGWDLGFIGGAMPRLIQEMSQGSGSGGAGGPGNALMTAYQAVVGGQLKQDSARVFEELGLLPAGEVGVTGAHHLRLPGGPKVIHTPSGHHTHLAPGTMVGSDLFKQNPYEWVQQILGPALQKKFGFQAGTEVDEHMQSKILDYMSQAFSNRTAGQLMTMMLLQGRFMQGENSPFEKDIKMQNMVLPLEQLFKLLSDQDPVLRMQMFTAQWESMLQAIGKAFVPMAIVIMRQMTDAFTAFGQWAGAHAETVKALGVGLASLMGALTVGGAAAIIAALGPVGWIAGGIAALATAIALVPGWREKFHELTSGISELADWLAKKVDAVNAAITGNVSSNARAGLGAMGPAGIGDPVPGYGPGPSIGRGGTGVVPRDRWGIWKWWTTPTTPFGPPMPPTPDHHGSDYYNFIPQSYQGDDFHKYLQSPVLRSKSLELFEEQHGQPRRDQQAMVPPPGQTELVLENRIVLDGHVIGNSVVRHVVAGLNSMARGSRLPDYTAIQPQVV